MAEPRVSVLLRVKDQATKKLRGFRNQLRGVAADVRRFFGNNLVRLFGFAAIIRGFQLATKAVDDYAASQLRLRGIAKITGVELSKLTALALQAEKQFKLSKIQANNFSSEMFKLAGAAGDLSKAAPALEAFLNIGAARGLDAEESFRAVRQAVLGIDEGTDKLFDVNPIELYKRYARQLGVAVGQLDDMQKKQAILNAALEDGKKVTSSYNDFLVTTLGKQAQFNIEVQNLGIAFGGFLNVLRDEVLPALTTFVGHLTEGIRLINLIRGSGNVFGGTRSTEDLAAEQGRLQRTGASLSGQIARRRGQLQDAGGVKSVLGIKFGSAKAFALAAQITLLEDQLNAANAALADINQQIGAAGPTAGPVVPSAIAGGGVLKPGLHPTDAAALFRRQAGSGGGVLQPSDILPVEAENLFGRVADQVDEVTEKASGMQDAFVQAFTASTAGAKGFGDALGKATIGAVKGTSRVLGREQFAKAAAKFAEGLWPPNPLAIASGLKHLGAGAAFMALAGGGGGGRAGGGVGGGLSPRTLGGGGVGGINPGGSVTIRMPRNAMAMTGDPFFQDWLAEALRKAGARDVTIEEGALA